MQADQILYVLRLPAVLRVAVVAVLLGFCRDAIYFFVEEGLLKPIGACEGVELLFDSTYINSLRSDAKWKAKAVAAWRAHTREKNEKQKAAKLRKQNEIDPHPLKSK